MDRATAKELIRSNKGLILAKVRKQVEQRHIHGELLELEINGHMRRMLHYGSVQKNVPVYFDVHGGGFSWGMMEEGDLLCHHINEQLDFECYSLDYPLCPDSEFPEALYCLYEVISFLRNEYPERNFDPDRMVVGGRSAGANLAASLCLLAKERGEFQFVCQVLDHPALDGMGIIPPDEPSRYTGQGSVLNQEILDGIFSAYASEEERRTPLCSPLVATKEQLAHLPPAVIQTCELDYLRPEGDLYAERLRAADVNVASHCYPKVVHGFTEVEGPEELNGQQYLIEHMQKFVVENQPC